MKPTVVDRLVKLAIALAAATMLMTVAAACDGGESGAPDGATETATPDQTATATTEPSTPTPTPSPSPTPTATDAGITLEEFVIKPDTTRASPGTVTFHVRNEGKVSHEFLVIESDLPKAQLPRDGIRGVDESKVDIAGRLEEIPPGGEDALELELAPGKYVLICNLFQDGESHYLSGMYNAFTVQR